MEMQTPLDNGPDAPNVAVRVKFAPGTVTFDNCSNDERAPGCWETPMLLARKVVLCPHFERGDTHMCEGLVMPEGATPVDVRLAGEDGPRKVLRWNTVGDLRGDKIQFHVLGVRPDE